MLSRKQAAATLRNPPGSTAEAPEFGTPMFATLAALLEGERKHTVLDLGATRNANLEFFAQFSCKIHIENLGAALDALQMPDEATDADINQRLCEVLPWQRTPVFDIVLCWDILNYLDRRVFAAMARCLAALCAPAGHLHAFMHTRETMPAVPACFEIVDARTMRTLAPAMPSRPSPRYHQGDLQRLASGFQVVRSVLLRNGMQEYLFRGVPGPKATIR